MNKLGSQADDALLELIHSQQDIDEARSRFNPGLERLAMNRWIAAHKVLVAAVDRLKDFEEPFGRDGSSGGVMWVDLHEEKSLRKRRNEQ